MTLYMLFQQAMERALEVFQPFLFLKMDFNITDCVDNAYNSLVSESIELRFKHNQAMQWKGLLKCSNHSFSLRWTLVSLAMERALEVFQPFLFLKMDVNITVSGDNRFAMERALEVFQPFLFLKMDVNITGHNELNSNKDLPTEYIELVICCLELNNGSSSLVEAIPKKMEIYFAP
ncbi:uncharacterized protein [Apostichopus japonicus]|uniref:uncharacterized protein isoform X4 n=1 Tax=Stichopus japonicus TaxID=307972 RepID=UPI003AB25D29